MPPGRIVFILKEERARAIAPADLVRLRVQKPVGPVKQPLFDEQTLLLHFECLAAVSTSRLF